MLHIRVIAQFIQNDTGTVSCGYTWKFYREMSDSGSCCKAMFPNEDPQSSIKCVVKVLSLILEMLWKELY